MTRVEWTRLEGNDVEAVVAMFVNREHPDSVRITPSRGDGGVDILDRGAGPNGSDVVYQVKSYARTLSSKQKEEVENSLATLMRDERWSNLNVGQWNLVTPWDPTPEAENWLNNLPSLPLGVKPKWKGLTYVEQLASKYPEIVDYYLHGGRGRVEEAYQSVSALFAIDHGADASSVPEIVGKIRPALRVLKSDPHYRYEFRFGDGVAPNPGSRPGLVMSWIAGEVGEGPWTIVDVIARCAASVDERPIVVRGHVKVRSGTPFEQEFLDFLNYGAPFTSPPGAYEGQMDAPGGLGGPINEAIISAFPVGESSEENSELHLEILSPDGIVLAAVDVDRVDRSSGQKGFRFVLEEKNKVFSIEDRFDVSSGAGRRNLRLGDLAGKPVNAIKNALDFIGQCRAPNFGRISVRNTPPERGVVDPNIRFQWNEETDADLGKITGWVHTLSLFQEYSSAVIRFPGNNPPPPRQLKHWDLVERIIREGEVEDSYPEGKCIVVMLESSTSIPAASFSVAMPVRVRVGTQEIDLGSVEFCLDDPTLVDSQEQNGNYFYSFTTPNRKIRYLHHRD